jgi:superfamily II DNA/RNA helicase
MLNEEHLEAIALRGDLPQNQRAAIMSSFARGQQSILVTTDLASRGLDLSKVGLVVNFDLPKNADEYIHRIGRTGRAGQKGEAFSLIGPRDWKSFEGLKNHLQYALECTAHPDIPAEFKGFAPKKKKATQSGKASGKKRVAKPVKAPVKKRVNTMTGEDIGMVPVKRKPRKDNSALDEE